MRFFRIYACFLFFYFSNSLSLFPDNFYTTNEPNVITKNDCDQEAKIFCSNFCAEQTNLIVEKLREWGKILFDYFINIL